MVNVRPRIGKTFRDARLRNSFEAASEHSRSRTGN